MKSFVVLTCIVALAIGSPLKLRVREDLDWRIVGGGPAGTGEFPYQVSLRLLGSHTCGGSIISPTKILTAAHCVESALSIFISVVAGTNSLSSGGTSHSVQNIRLHEGWDSDNLVNDIAVITLSSAIALDDLKQSIALETDDVGGDVDVILSGWGTTSYPGDAPNALQKLDLKTVTVSACQEAQSPNPVYDSQVCTFTKEGEGACHGDSGGPLVLGDKSKQVGIVSWGQPCAIGYPDVFTRVSSFSSWIQAQMDD